jgi:hypothetical protein
VSYEHFYILIIYIQEIAKNLIEDHFVKDYTLNAFMVADGDSIAKII